MPGTQSLRSTPVAGDSADNSGQEPTWRWALNPLKHSGHSLMSWLRLVLRNRLALNWRCWPAALVTTGVCGLQSILGSVQKLRYGRAVARTDVPDPIFVVGHWRSGTSLLHELLVLDEQHGAPSIYACLQPRHFLLTEKRVQAGVESRPAARRTMDNMLVRSDSPWEDEFALMFLGQPTPYEFLAFPNHTGASSDYFDLTDVEATRRKQWQRTLYRFVQELTFQHGKRIVLKSPLHSARIPSLLEVFPNASFVHIVRNPFVVFASTLHMWKSASHWFGMQRAGLEDLEERVLDDCVHLNTRLQEGKQLVAPERFYELRYEDLTVDPIGEMERAYQALGLGLREFEQVRPRIEEYFDQRKNYRTNRYALDPLQIREIERRWSEVIETYGYDKEIS